MRYGRLALVTVLASGIIAPAALAAPATTVQRTIQDTDGDQLLEYAEGEDTGLRLQPQDSIINVLQLSDFQAVDEESPGRVEWLDGTQRAPGLQPFSAAYRPQEALTTQIVEAMVRQARNAVSPVTGRRLDLTILTGDNADSQQYNETRWFIDILDGTTGSSRRIDPDSGLPTAGCPGTSGSRYDGVRGGGITGAPDDGYYEPDASGGTTDGDGYSPSRAQNVAETPGRDVLVRDFPGLFERANEPFEALGLDMPWYSAFGNHDALVQGNSPDAFAGPFGPSPEVFSPAFNAVATGCVKVRQPPTAVTEAIRTLSESEPSDALRNQIAALVNEAQSQPCDPATDAGCETALVPPDPRRCYLPKDQPAVTAPGTPCNSGSWIEQHFLTTGTPVGHGFALRPPDAIANHDGYYAFSPKPGLRFVVLDTITDECGAPLCSEGSIDDTQFRWLERELDAAQAAGEYVISFSHHTLRTIRFPSTDPTEQPLHNGERVDRRNPASPQGASPAETLEELYCRHPNVLAHVDGHEHANAVERHDCADDDPPTPGENPYFWEINTAAHIDWPQQSRMIELVDVGGTMAFVLTMLDHDGTATPGAGRAPSDVQGLAAIGRELAYNDYQGDRGARGAPSDRNVILPTDRPSPGAANSAARSMLP